MTFTDKEMRLAEDMRRKGATFNAISVALGRRSPDGIRRKLDVEYHKRRNAYMAKWMRDHPKKDRHAARDPRP